MLTDEQLLRYNRQVLMHNFDIEGQERLQQSRVLIVGLGGLGCPAAMYLAAAGVGTLLLADGDDVELSNLQRQIAHSTADIGQNKAQSAAQTVAALNPEVQVQVFEQQLDETQLSAILEGVDLVVDATDNYPIRFAMNRACIDAKVPLVSGAAVRSEGQVSVFDPNNGGPCYRCLYEEDGELTALNCSDSGVLSPVVGVVGAHLAMEALKVLTDFGEVLRGRLMLLDLATADTRVLTMHARQNCPACAHLPR